MQMDGKTTIQKAPHSIVKSELKRQETQICQSALKRKNLRFEIELKAQMWYCKENDKGDSL